MLGVVITADLQTPAVIDLMKSGGHILCIEWNLSWHVGRWAANSRRLACSSAAAQVVRFQGCHRRNPQKRDLLPEGSHTISISASFCLHNSTSRKWHTCLSRLPSRVNWMPSPHRQTANCHWIVVSKTVGFPQIWPLHGNADLSLCSAPRWRVCEVGSQTRAVSMVIYGEDRHFDYRRYSHFIFCEGVISNVFSILPFGVLDLGTLGNIFYGPSR